MARRKKPENGRRKEDSRKDEEASEKEPFLSIGSDAKRSVAAVFFFALALISALGFFGASGVIGESLNHGVGVAIGWAKFVFPIFLALFGIILLFRKETSFYVVKLAGLSVVFISLTGLFHWFYPANEMAKIASQGKGGGYLGYGVAYLLSKYMGSAGSLIAILCLIAIGTIVAFEFSLADFIIRAKEIFKKVRESGNGMTDGDSEDASDGNGKFGLDGKDEEPDFSVAASDGSDSDQEDEAVEANIANIEFVEGRDRFVDNRLIEKARKETGKETKPVIESSADSLPLVRRGRRPKWKLPPIGILEDPSDAAEGGDVERNVAIIQDTLRNFGIEVERGEVRTGPSVTQYSFKPAVGVKISKILSLQNDLALALAAHPIRIEAPIPGKSLIGIEVPNRSSATVGLKKILEGKEFKAESAKSSLTLALGEDVRGNYVFASLDRMPHLMIAGSTGTGKSVCVNSIIATLLYQNSPEDLKLIMVDPKRVELSFYNGIPHLLTDVIVDNNKVVNALKWAVGEMERRYKLLQESGSRDLLSYRDKIRNGHKRRLVDSETGETSEEDFEYLPYIVIFIDELSDLMGTHGKEVEGAIVRIAQMARAVGIHLVVSTQRPSVEVITGLIKANIGTRIAFKVTSQIDSRTIIDQSGAEKLLGRGDMLYVSCNSPKPVRVQGVYVNDREIRGVVEFIKKQKEALGIGQDDSDDSEEIIGSDHSGSGAFSGADGITSDSDQGDALYEAAKREVIQAKKASASLLQRRLRVGYARAARLIDILEENGVVGPADGAKPREVYGVSEADGPVYDDPEADQEKRDKWEM